MQIGEDCIPIEHGIKTGFLIIFLLGLFTNTEDHLLSNKRNTVPATPDTL